MRRNSEMQRVKKKIEKFTSRALARGESEAEKNEGDDYSSEVGGRLYVYVCVCLYVSSHLLLSNTVDVECKNICLYLERFN